MYEVTVVPFSPDIFKTISIPLNGLYHIIALFCSFFFFKGILCLDWLEISIFCMN